MMLPENFTLHKYMKNRYLKNNKGFTLREIAFLIYILFVLCLIGGIIYVICHFAAKFW